MRPFGGRWAGGCGRAHAHEANGCHAPKQHPCLPRTGFHLDHRRDPPHNMCVACAPVGWLGSRPLRSARQLPVAAAGVGCGHDRRSSARGTPVHAQAQESMHRTEMIPGLAGVIPPPPRRSCACDAVAHSRSRMLVCSPSSSAAMIGSFSRVLVLRLSLLLGSLAAVAAQCGPGSCLFSNCKDCAADECCHWSPHTRAHTHTSSAHPRSCMPLTLPLCALVCAGVRPATRWMTTACAECTAPRARRPTTDGTLGLISTALARSCQRVPSQESSSVV